MRYKLLCLVSLTILLWSITSPSLLAAPLKAFTPPTNITVRMYRLFSGGASTGILCVSNDTSYGCTAFVGDSSHAYPYGTANPVTIPIETDYLLDVVPSEISVEAFHPTAIQAQAIAARSYAYWHINQGSAINNSNQFQVFVPYAFEALPSAASPNFPDNPSDPCASTNLNNDQRIICDAVAPRYYISYGTYPHDDLPAFTEYFADIRNRTVSGGQPYLTAVDDPISSHPAIVQDGHGRGMSQKGASRWARGNLSYNMNRDLGSWSVRWERAEQILVHYYTGIHIRDASGTILTPEYRWVPLSITWSGDCPPSMQHGQTCTATFKIQNSGTTTWPGTGQVYLWYHGWEPGGPQAQGAGGSLGISQAVAPGETVVQTVTFTAPTPPHPGAPYRLRFDLLLEGEGWASELEPGRPWPTYDVMVCVDGPWPCQVFLPLVIKN